MSLAPQYPPQRVVAALRLLRVGRFDRLRLFHLADLDDHGATPDDPLKRLAHCSSPGEDLRLAFVKMRRAIQFAAPDISVGANGFIDKLEEMLCKALKKGVGSKALGRFYRACMCKVSTPVLRYVGGSGRHSVPKFDMAFLTEGSDALDEFKDAFYTRARDADDSEDDDEDAARPSKKRKTTKGSPSKPTVPKVNAPGKPGTGKAAERKARAAALKKYNEAAPKRLAGVASGAMVPLPADKSDASFVAFKTKHPMFDVPGCGKRAVCWNYVHAQGCNKKGACLFAHPH